MIWIFLHELTWNLQQLLYQLCVIVAQNVTWICYHCILVLVHMANFIGSMACQQSVGSLFGILVLVVILPLCYMFIHYHQQKRLEQHSIEKTRALENLFDLIKVANQTGTMLDDIICVIRKNNFDVNMKHPESNTGLTLFLCACLSGEKRLVQYMLKQGADICSRTSWHDSALHLATFACGTESNREAIGAVILLLQAGCEINGRNCRGNTPLSIAASYGKEHLVRYLLFQGADPGICNKNGIYPVDFATNTGYRNIANMLALHVHNNHVWDVVEPHTPPHIQMGLQTPSKHHLLQSTIYRNKLSSLRPTRRLLKPEE